MKKIFALLLMLVSVFALGACRRGDDNGDDVDVDQAKVDEAYTRADTLFVDTGSITGSFNLPKTMLTDVNVTWESANTDVINIETRDNDFRAVVTRPAAGEPNVNVEITATFTLNDVTRTRTWTLTVIAFPEADVYTDFSELFANANVGDDIEVEGIVVATFSQGYFITDGTLNFGVYAPAGNLEAEVGDKVNLVGRYANYHSLYQIDNVTETIISSGNEFELNITEISLEDLHALDSSDRSLAGQAFRITGVINWRQYGNFTNLAIEAGQYYGQIYFRSNQSSLDAIESFIGEMVTIDVIYYTNHSTDGLYLMFWGTEDDIEVSELTEEDMADLAAADLNLGFIDWIYDDMILPESGIHGSTIAWSSDNEAIIANDGTVTPGAESTEVTLTATITVGAASVTRDFVVTVADADFDPWTSSSVADAIAAEDDDIVIFQGIVTSYRTFGGGFFMQDEDGTSIFVTGNHTVTPGEKVVVYGVRDTHDQFGNNHPRIVSTAVLENDEGDHEYTVITGMTLADIIEDYPNSQARRYRVNLVEFIEITQHNEFMMVGNEEMNVFFDIRNYGGHLRDLVEAGDTIEWIEFTVSEISFNNLKIEGVVFPELSEENIETLLGIPSETTTDLELIEELEVTTNYVEGPVTYTIEWASDDEDVIALDGTVTQPAEGEPDAVVELTATVTLGEETMTFVITVTVAAYESTEPGEDGVFEHHDFGTETNWGYAAGELTWTNTDGTTGSVMKDRVQINTSTFEPLSERGAFMVFAPIDTAEIAWVEFDFSDYATLGTISFDLFRWSPSALDGIMALDSAEFRVEIKDGDDWIVVDSVDLQEILSADDFSEVTFDVSAHGAGIYRLVYEAEGAASGNTTQAITLDELIISE